MRLVTKDAKDFRNVLKLNQLETIEEYQTVGLKRKKGFYVDALGPCFVFVAFHNKKPLLAHYWSAVPGSDTNSTLVDIKVSEILKDLKRAVQKKLSKHLKLGTYSADQVTIHALGGEPMSQNIIDGLKRAANIQDKTKLGFVLNTDFLNQISSDQTLSIAFLKGHDEFYIAKNSIAVDDDSIRCSAKTFVPQNEMVKAKASTSVTPSSFPMIPSETAKKQNKTK